MSGEYGRRWLQQNRAKKTEWTYFNNIKKNFGLSREQHAQKLADQNGCCAICALPATDSKRRLAVDHDHTSLQVRALLCHHCNTGLGAFKDSPALLQEAVDYLRRWGK